ncbi:MAG: hypothetical protein J7K34_10925 [Flavobacteriaceae bacterium]|nr:hypothetical protein [Flavobacteriaceae bacterium]
MKNIFLLIFLFSFIGKIFAQDYKPYKIKSGKIEYELRKYATHSHFSDDDEKKSKWKEEVPYVAEIINYYWDKNGDVAFEESWEVAKFAGDPIPKTKRYEMLWIDDHQYHYDFHEDRLRDNPNNIRMQCRDRFQFYQITESWVETVYGAKKNGTVKILGKDADYYRANDAHDIYVWNGLVLKEETFATTREGKRLRVERTRIATNIETNLLFNPMMFDVQRLENDRYFQTMDKDVVNSFIDGPPNRIWQIQESGFKLKEGDIILYVTSDAHIGKFKVLKITKESLTIKYVTFNDYGDVFTQASSLDIPNNFSCELDNGNAYEDKMYLQDFRFKNGDKPLLIPFPTLGFYLVKESRNN